MAEDIKGLIEKIQKEGIQAAEDKSRAIEEDARRKANDIVAKAKTEAERLLKEAQDKIKRTQENTHTALSQAGRDMLINLKEEISLLLNRLILLRVREALTHTELVKILHTLIKHCADKGDSEITVLLSKDDLEKLGKGFLNELKEEIKKEVILKPSFDIKSGFRISYDAGKSQYDFTDKALADYIGTYLKPGLSEILNSAVSEKEKKA